MNSFIIERQFEKEFSNFDRDFVLQFYYKERKTQVCSKFYIDLLSGMKKKLRLGLE